MLHSCKLALSDIEQHIDLDEGPLIHPLSTIHQLHRRCPPNSQLQLQVGLPEVEVQYREEAEFRVPAESPGEYHEDDHRKQHAE
jgi:hypothetical protein